MTQGLVLYDASARIVTCNRRYIDMYSLSTDVVKPGCHFYDLIRHRKETGSFRGDVEEFCSTVMRNVAQGKVTHKVVKSADGRSFQIVNKPLAHGGWVATIEDITERQSLEQERDRNYAFLRQIIDHIPTQITVKDMRDHRYVLANRVAETQFGMSRDDIVGKTALDLFPKAAAEFIAADDKRALQSADGLFLDVGPVAQPGAGPSLCHLTAHRNSGSVRRNAVYHQRRRRCHRAPARRREDRAPRALRRADRPAEPGAVPRTDRTRVTEKPSAASSSHCSISTSTSSRASTIRSDITSATNC